MLNADATLLAKTDIQARRVESGAIIASLKLRDSLGGHSGTLTLYMDEANAQAKYENGVLQLTLP